MSLSWWWLGAVVVLVVVLSGAHWSLLDLLMDRFGAGRSDWWRDEGSEMPER